MNAHLFIDTYKSNKIKNGMKELRVNDSKMSMRWTRNLVNIGDNSLEIA